MIGVWVELLPLFVVRWLAVGCCERVNFGGTVVATARPDVFFRVRPAEVVRVGAGKP